MATRAFRSKSGRLVEVADDESANALAASGKYEEVAPEPGIVEEPVAPKPETSAVKAYAQALGEGVVGLAGLPAGIIAKVPSAAELVGDEQTAALAKQKRLEMAGQLARFTTLPGIQQELGLRTKEAIQTEREEHPYASAAGLISSMFVGPAAAKLLGKIAPVAAAATAAEDAALAQTAADVASKTVPAESAALVSAGVEKGAEEAIKQGARLAGTRAPRVLSSTEAMSQIGTDVAKNIQARVLPALKASPARAGLELQLAEARAVENTAKTVAERGLAEAAVNDAAKNLATFDAKQEITAKAIGLGLGRSLEGVLFGTSAVANELALGDPKVVGESALADTAKDALLFGLTGVVGEAGAPAAFRAGMRQAKKAARALDRKFLEWFPEAASEMTGAKPETVQALLEAPAPVTKQNVADMLEARMPKPEAPTLTPELPKVTVDLNKARQGLREGLQAELETLEPVLVDVNARLRKVEASNLIKSDFDAKKRLAMKQLRAEMPDVMFGRAESEALSKEAERVAYAPYQAAVEDLTNGISSTIRDTPAPAGTVVAQRLSDISERIKGLSEARLAPEQIHAELKLIKRELFDKAGSLRIPKNEMALLPQKTQASIDGFRRQVRSMLTDESLWGKAATREASFNEAYTAYQDALKNLKKSGLITYDFLMGRAQNIRANAKGISSLVRNIGEDSSANQRQYLGDYFRARRALIDQADETARFLSENVGGGEVAERLADVEQAYAKAAQTAVDRATNTEVAIQNKVIGEANKQAVAAYEAQLAKITGDVAEEVRLLKQGARDGGLRQSVDLLTKMGLLGSVGAAAKGIPGAGAAIGGYAAYSKARTALLSDPIRTAAVYKRLASAAKRVGERTDAIAKSIAGRGALAAKVSAVGATSVLSGNALREAYKKNTDRVQQLTQDADELRDHADTLASDLHDDAPTVAESMTQSATTAVQYLANKMPQPPPGLSPIEMARWEPNESQMRAFNRVLDALDDPMETLERAASGAIHPDELAAMDAAYPAMMNQFRQQLIKQIRATDKIPAASRRAASMILGYDIDGTVRPQRQLSVQSAYQQAAQAPATTAQGRPMKRFQAEALQGTADRTGRETAAWREAQVGARVGSGTR